MGDPRRPNEFLQERIAVPFDHAALSATSTDKFYQVPAGRKARVVSVKYINKTGLAQNGANSFALQLKNGSTVMADGVDTATTAITADTFTALTLSSTFANLLMAAGDVLSAVATKTGTQTLPAGRWVVELLLL